MSGVTLYASSLTPERQRAAFTGGEVPVAVYGLGKMGLPLAAVYADISGNVVGVDIDTDVVDTVNAGECHIKGEPGLPDLVADVVGAGSLTAHAEPEVVADEAAVHVIIVPTLITDDDEPDLCILEAVGEAIGQSLTPGEMVIVESTVPPRTCADVLAPLLEAESGLQRGAYGLAFCPERTSSGRALEDIRGAYPKVVGGIDTESTRVAQLIYEQITANNVLAVSDASTAEAVKVFEGLYRDVNIALANELARFRDELGIDLNEAIDVANTQPYCNIHTPGPGVGGHCIPYYPYFMIKPFKTDAPLLRTARQVNDSMPKFTVEKLSEALHRRGVAIPDAQVLVLGLTYRPGVAETRATPARPIIDKLRAEGAEVAAIDPILDEAREFGIPLLSLSEIEEFDPTAIVVVTAHEEFEDIEWQRFEDIVIIDGRQMVSEDCVHEVYTIGGGTQL